MGLVQSRSKDSDQAVEVEGFLFKVEQSLMRLIPYYGNVVVDFRRSFFGEGFTVRFGR